MALLDQELKELRDVLSLQEGAAGGAGVVAANAEAEAADLREKVGGLQREVAQAKGEAKAALVRFGTDLALILDCFSTMSECLLTNFGSNILLQSKATAVERAAGETFYWKVMGVFT